MHQSRASRVYPLRPEGKKALLLTGDYVSPRTGPKLVERLPFQVAAVGLTALLVPLLSPMVTGSWQTSLAGTRITQIAALAAALVALVAFRRFTAYPGTRGFAYVIPACSVSFGIVAVLLLGLRLPYSGSMLLTGYVAATAIMFILWYMGERSGPRRMYFVPSGNLSIIPDTPRVEWIPLTCPELPRDAGGVIVADLRHDHDDAWERLLAEAALSGRPVFHTKQLHESLTGRVEIEHLSENSFGSLIPNRAYHNVKRVIDVAACLLLIPLLALPMLLVGWLIRRDSRGPIFFRQERMGFRGRPFEVVKFRTMTAVHAVESDLTTAITQVDDRRITRLGRFLRRSRIDELPQLLNVLKGEMSWIGPRPEAMPLSRWYEQELPFYVYRHIVRPGITGWAQVNQGHVAELGDVHVKLHYDFYYIKHFSAWLDVLIAMRTLSTMLTGFGAR